MRRVGLVLLAFACVFVPAHAFGSQMLVPSDIGLTARGVALGNAMTAVAGDPSAIYHNPAILATYEHSQINTGYLFTDPSLSGGPKGNTNEFDEGNNFVLSNLVLSLRSMFKNNHPVAFGLSMYFDRNFRSLINFIDVEEGEGYFYRYGRASTAASMALGFAVTDWLYLGGGTVITLRGETDFQVNTDMAGNTSNEGMILDARLYYSPVASAFADFEVVDIGVTYHGENYGRFGDITVDAEATVGDSPLSELPLVMSFQDTFMPQNIALGFAFPSATRRRSPWTASGTTGAVLTNAWRKTICRART
ncbi:MAG: outer membrane protein transport protein [Deltaproteobacteria bacterium]|nr:outer membrane protein transport protein [Deltaproteobacteria bacterium]